MLCITIALSTLVRKVSATLVFSVIIDSVWFDEYLLMWSIAPDTPSTNFMDKIASRYSVCQSFSDANSISFTISFVSISPLI